MVESKAFWSIDGSWPEVKYQGLLTTAGRLLALSSCFRLHSGLPPPSTHSPIQVTCILSETHKPPFLHPLIDFSVELTPYVCDIVLSSSLSSMPSIINPALSPIWSLTSSPLADLPLYFLFSISPPPPLSSTELLVCLHCICAFLSACSPFYPFSISKAVALCRWAPPWAETSL